MKNKLLFLLTVLFSNGLYGQSYWKDNYVFSNEKNIKKITGYQYNLETSVDSIFILTKENALKRNKGTHYFDTLGNITREEYYNDAGTITKAFNYHYKDGKWIAKRGDTLFQRSYTKVDVVHFDNNTYATYMAYSPDYVNIDTTYYEDHYDGRMKVDYTLKNGLRAFEHVYIYDEEKKLVSQSNSNYGQRNNEYLFFYDEEKRLTKRLLLDAVGEIHTEWLLTYPMEGERVREKFLYGENRIKKNERKEIEVKDKFGNIIKTFHGSALHPRKWQVIECQIEYRK